MAKPRLGIIGLGYWGSKLCTELEALDNEGSIVFGGACDINKDAWHGKDGVFLTDSPEKLADYIDGIIIATPTKTHAELATKMLELKKAVLVEKPIARSVEDAEKILAMKGIAIPGHIYRFSDLISRLRRVVDVEFGKPLAVNFRWTDLSPNLWTRGDIIEDLMPHIVDITRLVFTTDISIRKVLTGIVGEKVTHAHIFGDLYSDKSTHYDIELAWDRPEKHRSIEILYGDKAITCDVVMRPDRITIQQFAGNLRNDIWVPPNNAMRDELRAFSTMIEYGEPRPEMMRSALEGIRVVEQIKEILKD